MGNHESASARWARVIRQQDASGLTIAEFCRRHEVAPPSFFAWRRRLRSTPAFVELKVAPVETPAAGAALEVLLPGGRRVLVRAGFDPQVLRDLLATLESPEHPEPPEMPA